ncbi:hypothetical protein BSKO_12619 [Bryopsis sp. KO-2023]|nr:hypothetical protein BSKO_12619 [Bryopsis sp. KO-2023]
METLDRPPTPDNWDHASNTIPLTHDIVKGLRDLEEGGAPFAPRPPRQRQPQEGKKKYVILGMEVSPDPVVKPLFVALYVGVALACFGLLILSLVKFAPTLSLFEQAPVVVCANVGVGIVLLVTLASTLMVLHLRLAAVKRKGFVWSDRRRNIARLHYFDLLAQTVNVVFYLVPNCYVLARPCGLFDIPVHASALVRSTMWNNIFFLFVVKARVFNLWVDRSTKKPAGRTDSIYLDAPLRSHWFLGVYWVLFQGVSVFTVLAMNNNGFKVSGKECYNEDQSCDVSTGIVVGLSTQAVLTLGYQLMCRVYLIRSNAQLKEKSYTEYRWTNVAMRYHFRTAVPVGDFIVLSFILLFVSEVSSCDSYILGWLGFLPSQVAATFYSVVVCLFWLPEANHAAKPRFRSHGLSWDEDQARPRSFTKPCFSFALAVRMYYWCEVVYDYDPAADECVRGFSRLAVGKELFELKHHRFFKGTESDTNALISWNDKTIVVSFRGTSSLKNVKADFRFWRSVHPPKRGHYFMGTRPLVHAGFFESWTLGGLNYMVVNQVIGIMHSEGFNSRNMRILVTGHSLGGALAVLASYDIARYCGINPRVISCYTFGAPRVGNHAFAAEYAENVPNTWQIVNDLDAVPRVPKFLFMFKHVGRRLIINEDGDIILCPLFVEVNLHGAARYQWGSNSVTHHLLGSYRKSLAAIVHAQFIKHKGLPGGMPAMLNLLRDERQQLGEILGVSGPSSQAIANLRSQYWEVQRSRNREQRISRMQRMAIRLSRCVSCLACYTFLREFRGEISDLRLEEYPTSQPGSRQSLPGQHPSQPPRIG